MHERGHPVMTIRVTIQVLIALFVISFAGLLLQYGGMFDVPQIYDGVVLSMKDDRFLHTRTVLRSLGIKVARKTPRSYLSKEVDQGLERHVGSREFHTDAHLRVWSNRMAFMEALEGFVEDSRCAMETWRFFFEDDIAMHPNVTAPRARTILANGVNLAEKEGVVYLGICGPICVEAWVLEEGVEAARCAGTCAHAFGFQRWKAAEFLTDMSALTMTGGHASPVVLGFFFDRYLFEYANQVRKIWVIGSNLKSPVQSVNGHYGLLFQDRTTFESSIGMN